MKMLSARAGNSKVNFFPVENVKGLVATATLIRYVSDDHTKDNFKESITGLKIIDGDKGLWVACPSQKDAKGRKDENGKDLYHDIVILSKGSKDAIIDLYKKALASAKKDDTTAGI